MTSNENPNMPESRTRWRLTLSRRNGMIAALFILIATGLLTLGLLKSERRVVRSLRDAGAKVGYDISRRNTPRSLQFLENILGEFAAFDRVVHVEMSGDHFVDADLEQLRALSDELEMLSISSSAITDAGLRSIAPLASLTDLDIRCPNVSGSGLVHLTELERLYCLTLRCRTLDDRAMEHIVRMRSLETLDLPGTRITDSGILMLKHLPKLSRLDIRETNVTDDGVYKLKMALPHLEVVTSLH